MLYNILYEKLSLNFVVKIMIDQWNLVITINKVLNDQINHTFTVTTNNDYNEHIIILVSKQICLAKFDSISECWKTHKLYIKNIMW